ARRDDHREPARRGPDRADPGDDHLLPRHRTHLGLAKALIKPILRFLSPPIPLPDLGPFFVVINPLMLALTSWLSGFTPFQFTIDSFFFSAIFAAIIVSIVSALLGWLAPERSAESNRR